MNNINFLKIREQILSCRICKDTFGYEPNTIFYGSKNSKIIQISQAPSKNVHLSSRPLKVNLSLLLSLEGVCLDEEETMSLTLIKKPLKS